MENRSIAILMATYNGADYLSCQIESIIAQTNHNWHLYVHDDGSTDETLLILNDYKKKYPKLITILEYPSQGGACRNFMSLLKEVNSDYYMFSDQDDYWHVDKVQTMIDRMYSVENKNDGKPVVVNCDLRVVDENLTVLHDSFFSYSKINPDLIVDFSDYVQNVVTGCAMLFNLQARNVALSYNSKYILMHDSWIMLRTVAEGGIRSTVYKKLVDYRQHSSNVLGAQDGNRFTIAYRISHVFSMICLNYNHFKMMHAAGNLSLLGYLKAKMRYRKLISKKFSHCDDIGI